MTTPTGIQVSAGARIWTTDGIERNISYTITYSPEDLWDASERGTAVSEQMVQDWLEDKLKNGQVKAIQLTPAEASEAVSTDGIIVDEHSRPAQKQAVPLVFEVNEDRDRLNRVRRAMDENYSIVKQNGVYIVTPLKSGQTYQVCVDLQKKTGSCTCLDFQLRGKQNRMPCKHIYAVAMMQDMKQATYIKQEV